ncbi:phenolic glucoside malonyltransferase 1-like [Argentina anserina]|uniref:phenolic glucoside malonyltransferase 1-like n=1 Tax=Argentina anserina TaxID=57926 RepID=UPI0021761E45|nr:phenolic glucoside malonyltransferase 1-like [Potentilla anserina]
MAQPNSVKVIKVCRVTPFKGSPDSAPPEDQYLLSLTFYDLIWLRFPTIQRIFFFQTPSCPNSILPNLKTSLSYTLKHFLPLAGNLTWPQDSSTPVFGYAKGDTVSLTIAKYSNPEDFHHLSGSQFIEAEKYHPLVPQLEASAPIALQVTLFPNNGFSIGTVMHHAVMDGKSYTSFIKSWAHVCKHIVESGSSCTISLPQQLEPFYDRTVVRDQAGLAELYSSHYLNDHGPNNRSVTPSLHSIMDVKPDSIRGTFELTREKIQALREHVVKTVKAFDSSSLHLSTFSLTCAFCWVCSVKAQEIKGGKTALIFAMDARARLDPPIPATYFGNCVVGGVAVAETKELVGDDGLVVALSAITEAFTSLIKKGVLNGAESWMSNFIDFSLYERVFSVAGSPRFEVYDTDFGWGRPKRTEVVSIDKTGAISLSASRNGGGAVEVGLVLDKQYMKTFATLCDAI